jgi:hypothetical protein
VQVFDKRKAEDKTEELKTKKEKKSLKRMGDERKI